ncbi:MAG: polysaccharide deacetylase family protein [Limisphaerales bacterium]
MLRPTMTRYQITATISALLGALALACGHVAMFWVVALTLLILIGLGSAIPQMSFFGPFVCRGTNSRRWVALTFDDGPDARSTPALLEVLRESGVKATFFCIGHRVAEHPELAARIVCEGHLLENHSYAHSKLTNIFTVTRLRADLERTQAVIKQATGIAPRWLRPPIGLSNPRVFHVARLLKLTMVGWSAGGLDTKLTKPERIVARVTRRLEPGAIILLHDGNIPADRLVATVKMLLDRLRTLEYEVVRLDLMLT